MARKVLVLLVNICLICFCAQLMGFEDKTPQEGSLCFFEDDSEGICGRHCVRESYLSKSLKICALDVAGVIACCRDSNSVTQTYPTLIKVCRERRVKLKRKRRELHKKELIPFEVKPPSLSSPAPTDPDEWNCGGSLIHPEYVLTAAHCITNLRTPPTTIRVSATNLVGSNAPEGRNFTIKEIYLHPKYTPDFYYNDIALLKLSERYDGTVSCIWPKRQIPQELTAIGFGAPGSGSGTPTNKLLKIKLSVINTKDCNKYYVENSSLPNGIVESQICAQEPEGKMDTCQGDSGSRLQFGDKFLVGITSFGKPCSSGTPGVFTRISSYLRWIEDVIKN